MRTIGIMGIIFCLIIGTYSFMSTSQTTAEAADTGQFLIRAMTATGAEIEGYVIHNWSVIDKEYRTLEELRTLGRKLNKTLGIQESEESADHAGDTASYSLRGAWKNGAQTQIVLKSMKFQDHAPQTALVIRVERDTNDLSDFSPSIQKVRETASAASTVPQISTCIKGFLADKMKNGESNALVREVFSTVKAKEIEGVRSDLVTSVSGYSPLSKDYIVTNGNKMNLQVAVHDDAHHGKTRVLVGSPIVTIEY